MSNTANELGACFSNYVPDCLCALGGAEDSENDFIFVIRRNDAVFEQVIRMGFVVKPPKTNPVGFHGYFNDTFITANPLKRAKEDYRSDALR